MRGDHLCTNNNEQVSALILPICPLTLFAAYVPNVLKTALSTTQSVGPYWPILGHFGLVDSFLVKTCNLCFNNLTKFVYTYLLLDLCLELCVLPTLCRYTYVYVFTSMGPFIVVPERSVPIGIPMFTL